MFGSIVNTMRSIFGKKRSCSATTSSRSARLAVESLEERSLLSLTPIAPVSAAFDAIVKIQTTFPDGSTLVGTGTMVDSFQVLTAGHVIYSPTDGGYAKSVEVLPAEYVGRGGQLVEPFGNAMAQSAKNGGLQASPTFMAWDRAHPGQFGYGDDDVGLISLDRNIGDRTGSMAFGYSNHGSYPAGTALSTAGYPTVGNPSYTGYQMEYGAGRIAGMSQGGGDIMYLQSSIPTFKGQSGSPVWETLANGERVIVGVVAAAGNGAANSLNAAAAITPATFKELERMEAAAHKPTCDPVSYDPISYFSTNKPGSATSGTVYSFD